MATGRIGRRGLVQGALAAVAAGRLPRLARPSDEWRVGLIGLGARGTQLLESLRTVPGVHITAVCDVDDRALARALRRGREAGLRFGTHVNCRDLLERSDVDAVVIATPNHWHALLAIWACQAGKDVYLEGLATHHLSEGGPLFAAAGERRVHCALPGRASPALGEAVEWVRAGNLGKIELVRVVCFVARPPIGDTHGNQRIPEHVDYDLWCGPAPLQPLRRKELHGDWRWSYATGGGELGERAAGLLDTARWVLGLAGLPASVASFGGRFGPPDDGETPNTQTVLYTAEVAPVLCEIRGLPRAAAAAPAADKEAGKEGEAAMDEFLGLREGVVVHGEHGTLRIAGHASAVAYDLEENELRRFEGAGDPFAGWIRACTGRREGAEAEASDGEGSLAAELEPGVRSSAWVHLGNASHRVGPRKTRNELLTELAGSPHLGPAAERMLAHLAANGLDLERETFVVGPTLTLDPELSVFRDHEAANLLLRGSHRPPFVLPGT